MSAMNLPCGDDAVFLSDYYAKDGYQAGLKMLSSESEFTAVLAINDSVAIGFIRALSDKGKSCPRDMSVLSLDQFQNAEYLTPRLTGIDQGTEVFGRFVIKTLLGAMRGSAEQSRVSLIPELVVRESCASINLQ
jgi:LacI family transcriptional regulator